MKKMLILALGLLLGFGPALAEGESFDADALKADAQQVAEAMLDGDFAAVASRFADAMAAQLDAATLEAGWTQTVATLGAWQECLSADGAEQNGMYVVTLTEAFAQGGLALVVAYDTEQKIAGMHMSYASLPDAEEEARGEGVYTEVELTVAGDLQLPLGATLCLPDGVENPPVVVFVHGSGSSDRDETVNLNKPFRDIAHGLAEQGVASLRYDKRYYVYPEAGQALGAKVGMRDEVLDDANAAVALMRTDGRVDAQRIYVLGHSMGGMLTPAIAAENADLAGIISMAGTLRNLWELVYDQNQEIIQRTEAAGLTEEQQAVLDQQVAQLEADYARLSGDFAAVPDDQLLMGIPAGYWKSLKEYGGMNFIDALSLPILVLQGDADFQVFPDKDYTFWQQTIGDRENAVFHLYEGLNHLMMPTQGKRDTGDYQQKSSVAPAVIKDIAAFVHTEAANA